MAEAYRITEWQSRYEVDDKGRAWQPDKPKPLRKTSLLYIRRKVHGRGVSAGFAALREIAGPARAHEVVGMFDQFLGIAAVGSPENRGILRNHRKNPGTVEDLARMCRATVEQIEFAMSVLCNTAVGWVEKVDCPGKSGNDRKNAGGSRKIRAPYNRSIPIPSQIRERNTNPIPSHSSDVHGDRDGLGLEKSLEDRGLELEGRIQSKAIWFTDELAKKFHTISKDEATTFARITQHLSDLVRTLHAEIEIFDQALGWADEATSIGARSPKAVFVEKVKQETGFTGRGLLLKADNG